MSILIQNAYILTMNPEAAGEIKNGYLFIEDNLVQKMGTDENNESASIKADKIIDAGGSLVMPGLCNTHTHLGMTLLRGYADDMVLKEWLENKISTKRS